MSQVRDRAGGHDDTTCHSHSEIYQALFAAHSSPPPLVFTIMPQNTTLGLKETEPTCHKFYSAPGSFLTFLRAPVFLRLHTSSTVHLLLYTYINIHSIFTEQAPELLVTSTASTSYRAASCAPALMVLADSCQLHDLYRP